MIKAKFFTDKDSGSIIMKVSGHAKQDEHGKDLVCAAASILDVTLAQTVIFANSEGKLKKKPNIQIDSGKSYITVTPKPEYYAEMLHAYFIIQVGFDLLSRNLPEYVQLTSFGDSEKE